MPENKQEQPLLFDPEKHIYTVNGKRLPSVTDIVGDECGNPMYATEWHMNRGTQVHKCLALYLAGVLDESSVDPAIRARVDHGKKAIRELQIHPKAIEHKMAHKTLGFAGTPDLLCEALGKPGDVLLDWKSSHQKEVIIQAGGYVLLFEDKGYSVKRCFEIILEDKRYILNEYSPSLAKRLFLAAYTMYQFRHNT